MFGNHLENNGLYPVPHRQYVFSLPIMLCSYFKYDRKLLSTLYRCAYDSLHLFFKTHIKLEKGVPGATMVIHTFGNAPDKYHPHVHLIFKMLQKEGKIDQEMIRKLLKWKHSGFGIDNGVQNVQRQKQKEFWGV